MEILGASHNRTKLELKHISNYHCYYKIRSHNRTKLELKP